MDEQGSPSNLSEAREKNEGFIRKRQAVFLNSYRQGDQILAFPASSPPRIEQQSRMLEQFTGDSCTRFQ
jgi:hypothetical protein